jgi:diketogulonate reductase-like aldo/keto reductase
VTADGRVLADGNEIPLLGLGVWQVPNGPKCVNAVRWVLETGYRHVDTAQLYGNEESVGRGCARADVEVHEDFALRLIANHLGQREVPAVASPSARASSTTATAGSGA